MKTFYGWSVSSIFILFLTDFAIQMRSDEAWIPPQTSHPFASWYISDKNYTAGSPFESNLMRVMNSLAHNTSQTGFNMSSYGQNPNKVYGLLQCRGNTSQSQCRKCAQSITRYAIDSQGYICLRSTDCQIWFDACYVRYANFSVFEKYTGSLTHYGSTYAKHSKSPSVFRTTLENLLSSLSAEACQDGSKGFAAQSANYSTPSLEKIDAFVECSRDLSSANCSTCLARGFEVMRPLDHLQAQFYHKNCLVRYVSTELDYGSTEPGNVGGTNWGPPHNVGGTNWGTPHTVGGTNSSSSQKLLIMWVVLIEGLLLSIFAIICA